ncbi:nuclear transport factor 2 family protein [Gemmatimonas sp.]
MTHPLHEFAERYTAAWCSQNPDQVAACFAVDGVLTINGGSPHVGRTAIAESAAAFMTAFPDLVVALRSLASHDDRVWYDWVLTGTNTGPGGTGRPVRINGREAWRMTDNGLISDSIGSFDVVDYERQLSA